MEPATQPSSDRRAPAGELAIVFAQADTQALGLAAGALVPEHVGALVKAKAGRVMAAFTTPAGLLAWTSALPDLGQLAVGAWWGQPVRRVAAQTGELDYFGPVVNRAARVCAAAHPGQCVVDAALAGRMGARAHALSLGPRILRGVPRPVELVQVSAVGAPTPAFPPLRAPAPARTNLAGLAHEHPVCAEALSLLRDHRMLTLTGPPGAGKSYLARVLGQALLEGTGEVWIVDLAGRDTQESVRAAVADTLGFPLATHGQVEPALRDRGPLTLLLDDADDAGAFLLAVLPGWLAAAPQLRAVVTARGPLTGPGRPSAELDEARLPIPPLTPDAGAALFLQELERTRGAGLGAEAGTAREIARQLDGNPLALRLAAARCAVLSPSQLLGLLDRRLDVLRASGGLDGARHPSLRSAVEELWDSLPAHVRSLVHGCTVFADRVPLHAASLFGVEPSALEALVHRSLATWEPALEDGDVPRVRLWRALRDRATEEGPPAPALMHAHGAWLEETLRDCFDLQQLALWRRDLNAASHRAPDPSQRATLLLLLERLRSSRGPHGARSGDLQECLALEVDLALRVDLLRALMAARFDAGDPTGADAAWRAADALLPPDAAPDLVARVRLSGAGAHLMQGRATETVAALEAALPHLRDPRDEARAWTRLAIAHLELGDAARSRAAGDRAATLHRALSDARSEARVLANRALLDLDAGAPEDAIEALQRSLTVFRATGEDRLHRVCAANLGLALLIAGRPDEALPLLQEADAALATQGDRRFRAYVLCYVAAALDAAGHAAQARAALDTSRSLLGEEDPGLASARAVYEAILDRSPLPPLSPMRGPLDARLALRVAWARG